MSESVSRDPESIQGPSGTGTTCTTPEGEKPRRIGLN